MATVATNQYTYGSVVGHGLAQNLKVWYGTYTISSALSANDLINLFKLPKNCLIMGGHMTTTDIDTGTETLEIDIGFTANGGGAATVTLSDGTTYTNNNSGSASSTAFIDSGVLNGDAITDMLAASTNHRPVQGVKTGPMFFSEETLVQAKIQAAANSGGTGTVFVALYGIVL